MNRSGPDQEASIGGAGGSGTCTYISSAAVPHRRGSHLVFVFGFLQVRFYLLPHIAIGPFRLKVRTAEYPAKQFVMMLNM